MLPGQGCDRPPLDNRRAGLSLWRRIIGLADTDVLIDFDHRASGSRYVERIWRSRSRLGGSFLSMAESAIEIVVSRLGGMTSVTLRGPVTIGGPIDCPPGGEWLAIRFRTGVFLPAIPTHALADRNDLALPVVADGRFRLGGTTWEIPRYDTAEDLVDGLARAGIIAISPIADAAAEGDFGWMSRRSLQRHFQRAAGMTISSFQQIERARHAAFLLTAGRPLLDTTFDAGYFDQAHLTRSVKRLIGMTPARLSRERPQLSFSYKTCPA